jgi:hypothetical protein
MGGRLQPTLSSAEDICRPMITDVTVPSSVTPGQAHREVLPYPPYLPSNEGGPSEKRRDGPQKFKPRS